MSKEVAKAIIGFFPPSHMINDQKVMLKEPRMTFEALNTCTPPFLRMRIFQIFLPLE